ncbi:sulfate ABC transporter permease subunit [Nesterenkonia lacusekhoensis]|uniref:Sulfate transport system permease protein n=1 Tax=Nesterenkonia lacusekhoensis TaxID=150832 RepID=A0ABS4T381_9MICC|nr:sulfate ABC transporter permease subunit [Nesterenkonia lacusekhoensis]MBP2318918.1 sulfate transport system permease protein [Nesterenkonia lacusekhoensis]
MAETAERGAAAPQPAAPQPAATDAAEGAIREDLGRGLNLRQLIVVIYLVLLVGWPLWRVVQETFFSGQNYLISALQDPAIQHALQVTVAATAWAVALNTVFGITLGILLVRYEFPGRRALSALLDLPTSVSPIVVGMALLLAYGPIHGVLGGPLFELGVRLIFSFPGIVLAVTFVSLPLVLRAVVPVLQEVGTEQEMAAKSLGASGLQVLRRITLPSIRWAAAYGIVLTVARAVGEFGAVVIVSGGVVGQTETATIAVQRLHQGFETGHAYAVGFLLALISVAALAVLTILRPSEKR